MQRKDATEPLTVDQRLQRGQRGVGLVGASLCPGEHQRLQKLGQSLAGNDAQAHFRCLPLTGLDVLVDQQQPRDLVVGQAPSELCRVRPAREQGGDEGLLHQLRIVRALGESA